MKICIVSDSHDNRRLLEIAVKDAAQRGAEAVLHCGDVVAPTTLKVLQKYGLGRRELCDGLQSRLDILQLP